MNHCDRFEQEGLLKLEQGDSLDQHFSECDDCIEKGNAYQKIKMELKNMQQQWKAPQGWQDRVWETIAERQQGESQRWKWAVWPAAAAIAGVFLIFGVLLPNNAQVSINVSIEKTESATRGLNAKPGDELVIDAEIGNAEIAELLVYRNDNQLVLRCSDQPPCIRRGRRLQATVELQSIGNYQPVLVLAESVLPQLTHQLDVDASLVLESGARVELAEQVSVY